tara:strand:+ start:655 stop:1623 length:969 start_codon:yes stop_codon:yes gene_type:complete
METESGRNQTYTLVTGATGFIGQELIKIDHPFICVTRNKWDKMGARTFQVKSINEHTNWKGAFKSVDSIIHLAGLAHNKKFTEEDYLSVNINGTLKLANEASKAGVRRFIFVSSIAVNGATSGEIPFTPNSVTNPNTHFATSKLTAEKGLIKIAEETGLEVVIVRPPLVYGKKGPGNFGKLIKIIERIPIMPFKLVDNKRSLIYIKNLSDLLITCVKEKKAANSILLPCDRSSISTGSLISKIAQLSGNSMLQLPVPPTLLKLAFFLMNKKEMGHQLLDNLEINSSHIEEKLNWHPPFTTESALRETFQSRRQESSPSHAKG